MLMLFVDETELAADVWPTPDPLPAPALRLATAAKVSRRLTADISDAVKFGSDTLMLDVEDLSEEAEVSIWNWIEIRTWTMDHEILRKTDFY